MDLLSIHALVEYEGRLVMNAMNTFVQSSRTGWINEKYRESKENNTINYFKISQIISVVKQLDSMRMKRSLYSVQVYFTYSAVEKHKDVCP